MGAGTHDPTTAAMQEYGASASPDNPRGTRAGLVLLYAPQYEGFAPAYLLSERDLIIGRDPSAGICIPEAAVSRQHASVRYEGKHWVVSDLKSRNGTLVDGQFISEVALEDLHEIRIGDAIFKFVSAGAESYALYRIDGCIVPRPAGTPVDDKTPAPPPPREASTSIIGGFQIRQLCRALERVSRSEISVVLLGESGTGKEVFARELHTVSGRRGAFQAVNCAAIPAQLLESELFGYKRGAFSGAERDKVGLVKAADGGTLFLDEIGDMPLDAQAKLLRVLQTREIVPVGGTIAERVDVRVLCATHRDLAQLQRDGKFRGDLFARLNEYSLRLPPLRERKEDIYCLTRGLLARHGRPDLSIGFPFMTGLLHYDWPFNVRELEATIKRGVALAEGTSLDAEHLPDVIKELMNGYGQRNPGHGSNPHPGEVTRPPADPLAQTGRVRGSHEGVDFAGQTPLPQPAKRVAVTPTEAELRALLGQHRGNIAAVGREFGKERMQVHRWMKRYGIDVEEYR